VTDKGTILVIDDSQASLRLLSEVLTAEGYQVTPANSGELALATVAANPPELIMLDIQMPGLNGFEVCRRLKAGPESRDIPIIFISAFGESGERVEGLKLGAVDFVNKPFQREELLARVRIHLELRRLRVRLENQGADLRRLNEQLQDELTERDRVEKALRESYAELAVALANVKSLSGLLPICSSCKGIRDDTGYWSRVETYIENNSEATFTHSLCPDCFKKHYPTLVDDDPGDSPQEARGPRGHFPCG
jgi:DNA-binding response OmpR family regulator